ncbi:MAG: PP2C family protein-serine/threonine phosphatase [Campylobacterota bacterium]|nr:PP2C family protein-serine/threonine phosphatase [Campylobacterota bacterium]
MPHRAKKLKELQEKHDYHSYQEDLAFKKELNILRNDFYYQMIDSSHISLVDFLYQPLDLISGDAYTARRIDEHRTFYLIVDGMGKGLSASLTAMIMTSFVNHLIDRMTEYDSFSLDILVKESMDYMRPILLDEEAVAVDYILFDTAYDKLSYAKFAMPASLMQDKSRNILKIKSNNPPLSKYTHNYKIDEQDVKDVNKFLFFSDGVVENTTKDKSTYADFIEDDFNHSFTREDLKRRFFEKIDEAEDDITLIFINRIPFEKATLYEKSFPTSLKDIDQANEWYEELWSTFTDDATVSYKAGLVFSELYMNAYEHGNLDIDSKNKHKLIDDDIYFETLKNREKDCDKKINVKVSRLKCSSASYIITQISDEGNGFDTQILSEIFRNSQTFNGRGVFISRSNSLGIYYNSKGTSVLYLHKV